MHASWHTHVVSWHGIDVCRISALLTHTTPHRGQARGTVRSGNSGISFNHPVFNCRCTRLRVQTPRKLRTSSCPVSSSLLAALTLFYGIFPAIQLVSVQRPNLEGDDIGCAVIGFFSVFSSWVKLMFTSWVVLHLLCFSVFYKNLQHLEKLFVFISIGFPLA